MTSWKSSHRWVVEWHSPESGIISVASEILYSGRTKYQEVDVVRNDDYGKILVLDGKFQSSLSDEFIYHEMLVHPALITQGNPRDVLIGGGGRDAGGGPQVQEREEGRHGRHRRGGRRDLQKVPPGDAPGELRRPEDHADNR
ncbi:MAG: hypothetical protein C0167_03905 [Nitrososphaera sp.]|nr:MAG: hypothetical protein C0167_03905 [Nitrososphaera sp.]